MTNLSWIEFRSGRAMWFILYIITETDWRICASVKLAITVTDIDQISDAEKRQ